jgi:hypothetical protein
MRVFEPLAIIMTHGQAYKLISLFTCKGGGVNTSIKLGSTPAMLPESSLHLSFHYANHCN